MGCDRPFARRFRSVAHPNMANILLIDPSEVAQLAMRGILQRGHHRLVVVKSAEEAWKFIHQTVKIDVVFSELKIDGGGLALAQRLKEDSFRRLLPFVFYTEHGDREAVKRALELRVQNFLIKPYQEDLIHAEIAKAQANPWRARHFEEEKSFCQLMGFAPAELHRMLEELRTALVGVRPRLDQAVALEADRAFNEQLGPLAEQAEAAGAWGVVEYLTSLRESVVNARWAELPKQLDALQFADQLIFRHLNQALQPEVFLSVIEAPDGQAAAARAWWANAPAEGRCPLVSLPQFYSTLDALAGCPVVDSSAAAFKMSASGDPTCISPLMDMVERDPGLAAQLLITANRVHQPSAEVKQAIDDPRLAVGLLGELRLVALARALVMVPERHFHLSTSFNWPQFWMYQNGVSQLAAKTCRYMEFPEMEALAQTAGLLHDLGKLLLCRLEPTGFQAIYEYAHNERVPLHVAERKFLGCTTNELAVHFAEKHGLPKPYINVMRWIDTPAQATEDIELVAVVSLARDFCRHNHLGSAGDPPLANFPSIDETEVWRVLRERVFPGFNLRKFELKAHADCHDAKIALRGRVKAEAVA